MYYQVTNQTINWEWEPFVSVGFIQVNEPIAPLNKFHLIAPESARHLENAREVFQLLNTDAEARNTTDWIEKHFPIASWGRINWEQVPNCIRKYWHHQDDFLPLYFREIVDNEHLKGNVTISWTNALRMPIYLDIEIALKYAQTIFEEDWDTWIFSVESNWCLEVYHDEGEICFGYSALINERE